MSLFPGHSFFEINHRYMDSEMMGLCRAVIVWPCEARDCLFVCFSIEADLIMLGHASCVIE